MIDMIQAITAIGTAGMHAERASPQVIIVISSNSLISPIASGLHHGFSEAETKFWYSYKLF